MKNIERLLDRMRLEEVGQVFVDGRVINLDKAASLDKLNDLMDKTLKEEEVIMDKINKLTK